MRPLTWCEWSVLFLTSSRFGLNGARSGSLPEACFGHDFLVWFSEIIYRAQVVDASTLSMLLFFLNSSGSAGKVGQSSVPLSQLKMILPSRPLPFTRG